MELSAEDALRLNVLLANPLQALRIDESKMSVCALSEQGVASIQLRPAGRHDQYIRAVKELISSQVLGSPGGYPVYLKRWSRMGQARDDSLEQLLMLGEPEAVVAAVHAQGLTHELARRAWWALPEAETARCMLARDCVVEGDLGKELAEYLLEYLPFESEPQAMMDSIRLILQPGLISAAARLKLWTKARHKNAYYVGFLLMIPDALPEEGSAHAGLADWQATLTRHAQQQNACALQLLRVLTPQGQVFLRTAEQVMRKPNNQDVVLAFIDVVRNYFSAVRPPLAEHTQIDNIFAELDLIYGGEPVNGFSCSTDVQNVLHAQPELLPLIRAMQVLASLSYQVVTPIFSRTDAIGSVMRKKLGPVTTPILQQLAILRGEAG